MSVHKEISFESEVCQHLADRGWLYTDEEFDIADDAQTSVAANLAAIAQARDELAQAGVKLVAVVVPAKARTVSRMCRKDSRFSIIDRSSAAWTTLDTICVT